MEINWLQHSTVDQKSQVVQAPSLFHPGKPSPGTQMLKVKTVYLALASLPDI